MKTFFTAATLSLATLGFTSPAAAFHFEPVSTPFTATGAIVVSAAAVSLPCQASLGGSVAADGSAKITSASFSGLSCAALTASNLPWKMVPAQATKIKIHHVTVSALVLGICGPGNIKTTLSSGGVISIAGASLPGLVPCAISGTLQTLPHLRIHS